MLVKKEYIPDYQYETILKHFMILKVPRSEFVVALYIQYKTETYKVYIMATGKCIAYSYR